MKRAALLCVLAGCWPYGDYLLSLPITPRERNQEAIDIVADVYGIERTRPEVFWTPENIYGPSGDLALGITVGCDSWVWWPSRVHEEPWSSTTFAPTALAHEIAHCAIWLTHDGYQDADHTDVEWWGPRGGDLYGGRVGEANAALAAAGL